MKSIDKDKIDKLLDQRLERNDTFEFKCHKDLACFNRCCRNLNLFLYPYDVLRLKNNLGISSEKFLDEYTDIVSRPGNHFPDVLLKMAENEEKTCPFLTESGCSVYPDRPDTCRSFPIEQGRYFDAETKETSMIYLFRPPDFCLGQHENKKWTINEWIDDQDALTYGKMTVKWAETKSLFTSESRQDPWAGQGPKGAKAKMSFMASYNTDLFKDFVFGSTFLKRYKIKPDRLKKIKRNDVQLLMLGFDWIKFSLWGIKSSIFKLRI